MSVTSDAPSDPRTEVPWPEEAMREAGHASVTPPPRSAARPPHPSPPIGRLRRVAPGELWRAETLAAWLADNLDEVTHLLGGTLERGVVDPAAPGTVSAVDATGSPVRLVTELGPSSDETFGLLMRQLVSSGTRTAVWICGTARDEHLTSVTWLNREISGRLHVLTVDAVRIDDSAAAPVFRLALKAAESAATPPA
jgi:hypothetical protein